MHADEIAIDVSLVRRLLRAQFPMWAELPLTPVRSAGTDNALFRLGDDLTLRLPRIHWAAEQPQKEWHWLPRLAPHLPLAVPIPVALGQPDASYPFSWTVCRWIDGQNATLDRLADPVQAARDLAHFLTALHACDTTDGPPPGAHNSGRGEPLAHRDDRTRQSIAQLPQTWDIAAITAIWETSVAAPAWSGPPVWVHGDLQSGNLLCRNGRLCAVIDFGCLGVGDPAVDLMTAWLYLPADARAVFRETLPCDEATWTRARGWALSVGAIAYPYYRDSNPTLAHIARRALQEASGP